MRKKHFFYLYLFFIFFSFGGCGKPDDNNDENTPNTSCSLLNQKKTLYDLMQDVYLFYDKMPVVDYTDPGITSPEMLLKMLRYKEIDKWSFMMSQQASTALFEEGKTFDLGLILGKDQKDEYYIGDVYKESPAGRVGIKRGDRLIDVDDSKDPKIFKIKKQNGGEIDYPLKEDWINLKTAFYHQISSINNKKIGYLVYLDFIDTSELGPVFKEFHDEKIDELILDLRYNTGGKVEVATELASLITGNSTDEKVFAKYKYNDKYNDKHAQMVVNFKKEPDSLNMQRVFVVSTKMTASASELIINNLKPYITVITIGSKTEGKAAGMNGYGYCGMVIFPLTFKLYNANNEGEYFDGIKPTCNATDDITKALGDTEESSLKETLYYIQNGKCSPESADVRFSHEPISPPQKIIPPGIRRPVGF